jgi:iron complex transport system ATP-binding protein
VKGINGSTPAISLRLMKHKTKRFFSNRSPLQQNQKQKESRLREQNSFGVSVEVSDLSWSLKNNRKVVLHNVSFDLERGKTLGIVGPNGAGKTTLLRMLYRYNAPTTGQVKIDGVNIWRMSPREVACKVAAVLQEQPTDFLLTVRDIVALGRTPHLVGLGGMGGKKNCTIVDRTIDRLELGGVASRSFGTLSGGERQRVMIARAIAQEPSVLILDEPTNHLDIRHQLETLELIDDLSLTIIISLHDLNVAAEFCDEVAMLDKGRLVQYGKPDKVFSTKAVSETFQVNAQFEKLMPSNNKMLTFNLQS